MTEAPSWRSLLFQTRASTALLIQDQQSWTGDELERWTLSVVFWLQSQGLKPGNTFAIELENCAEHVTLYLAGFLGGFTVIPINVNLPEKDKAYILKVTRPRLHIRSKLQITNLPAPPDDIVIPEFEQQRTAGIFFTSGTTGVPKGICHSIGSMISNAMRFNELAGLDQSVRLLHVMPMGYMAGLLNTVLSPLLAGGCVIVAPTFSATNARFFWGPAQESNCNAVWLTPTMAALLTRLLRDTKISKWTRENLKHVFVGTAPLQKSIQNRFEEAFGISCLESYGMSEALLISTNSLKRRKSGTVGQLLEGIELQVHRGETDVQHGELWIKTPYALTHTLVQDTKIAFTKTWLPTGDYGKIDTDGFITITGRKKDLIIVGGVNVSPKAVEDVLRAHVTVNDAAIVGKEHPFWGEEVCAFIILQEGATLDIPALKKHCAVHCAPNAIPTRFIPLLDFPRSSLGKIQKTKLRKMT